MKRVRRTAGIITIIFALMYLGLGGYFAYSVSVYSDRWFADPVNPNIMHTDGVIPGTVYDKNGMVLAKSVEAEEGKFTRVYAESASVRRAVSQLLGDTRGQVANGVESFMSAYLLGYRAGLMTRLSQSLSGEPRRGDNIRLTIDAMLCVYAAEHFPVGKSGAVVVLNYKTGDVLAMVSLPNYDPASDAHAAGSYYNRVTNVLYPPGSTFKLITYAAALKELPDVETRTFNCTGRFTVDELSIVEASGASHGSITLRRALEQSCNITFAQLALEMGYPAIERQARAFGFNDTVLFHDLVVRDSKYPITSQTRDDLAQSSYGQGRVETTPLAMALVAATIANNGTMMEPKLLDRASPTETGGLPVGSSVYRKVLDEGRAAILKEAMVATVQAGSASQASINGYRVGGKTGSAEVSSDKTVPTHAWFTGFIDDPQHPLAICVLIEGGGSGASAAAPLARDILREAIRLND
ncbi:peptidoglycan glycosyltransferase [Clostridia bacterium]|nr:peptidoglycan glycosyltransferase [Clostridia bacterium]